jgi:hypothetical protein
VPSGPISSNFAVPISGYIFASQAVFAGDPASTDKLADTPNERAATDKITDDELKNGLREGPEAPPQEPIAPGSLVLYMSGMIHAEI